MFCRRYKEKGLHFVFKYDIMILATLRYYSKHKK